MRWISLLLGLISACQNEINLPVLLPADRDDFRSMVIAIDRGGQLDAKAFDLTSGPTVFDDIPYDEDRPILLSILLYRESLEALSLSAGELKEATQGDCSPYAFRVPDRFFSAAVEQRAASDWTETATLSAALKRFRYLGPCVCRSFVLTSFDTRLSTGLFAVVKIDEASLLAVPWESENPAWLITREAITPIDLGLPALEIFTAFRSADGEIWLGTRYGELWHGGLSTSFTATTTEPHGRILRWVTGQSDPFAIFFSTWEGTLERFDDRGWSTIYEPEQAQTQTQQRGGIALLGPGHVVSLCNERNTIVEFNDGTLKEMIWEHISTGYPRAIEGVDGRAILGTFQGRYYWYQVGGFEQLEGLGSGRARSLAPFPGGFLYGAHGLFGQYHETQGFCPALDLNWNINVETIRPMPGFIVVTGQLTDEARTSGSTNDVMILTSE